MNSLCSFVVFEFDGDVIHPNYAANRDEQRITGP